MIKKTILTVFTGSKNLKEVKTYLTKFICNEHPQYKYTYIDSTKAGRNGVILFCFLTHFDSSFIRDILTDDALPYHFTVYTMSNDDNYDYNLGEGLIFDDLESINKGFNFTRPIYTTDSTNKVEYRFYNNTSDINTLSNPNENTYTIDELLDIIEENGYDSLTENQKKYLDNYQ